MKTAGIGSGEREQRDLLGVKAQGTSECLTVAGHPGKGLLVPELLCHDPVMEDFIFGVGSHIIIPFQLE
jgi:hypothetical protein